MMTKEQAEKLLFCLLDGRVVSDDSVEPDHRSLLNEFTLLDPDLSMSIYLMFETQPYYRDKYRMRFVNFLHEWAGRLEETIQEPT